MKNDVPNKERAAGIPKMKMNTQRNITQAKLCKIVRW